MSVRSWNQPRQLPFQCAREDLAMEQAAALLLLGASSAPEYSIEAIRYADSPGDPLADLVIGAPKDEKIDTVYVLWLIRGGGRNILFDSGFHRPRWFKEWTIKNYLRPDEAVRLAGVKPEEVTDVADHRLGRFADTGGCLANRLGSRAGHVANRLGSRTGRLRNRLGSRSSNLASGLHNRAGRLHSGRGSGRRNPSGRIPASILAGWQRGSVSRESSDVKSDRSCY